MVDLFADAEGITATDGEVASIASLADQAIALQAEVDAINETLTERNKELDLIVGHKLPTAMLEAGCEEFKASNGAKITLKSFVSASLVKDKIEEAFEWLREKGHGDLIKREFKLQFGRGEDNLAGTIKDLIFKEANRLPDDKTSVHPQTLNAFCTEQVAAGQEFPAELFSVYIGRRAKITPTKEKR